MMINVLNGTLDIGIGEVQEVRSQLEADQIRLLGTFNPERMADFPDVPTVKESGYDVVLQKFRGLAAPKGLPDDIGTIWDKAAQGVLNDPEYKKVYQEQSLVAELHRPHAISGLRQRLRREDHGVPEAVRRHPVGVASCGRRRAARKSPCRKVPFDEQRCRRRRGAAGLRRGLFLVDAANPGTACSDDAFGARGLPHVLAVLLAVLALIISFRGIRALRNAGAAAAGEGSVGEDGADHEAPLGRALGLLLIGVGYILVLPVVGYPLGIALLIATIALYEGAARNWRIPAAAIFGGVLFWLMFNVLLGVGQPSGWLF